jgi:hypothetical protein
MIAIASKRQWGRYFNVRLVTNALFPAWLKVLGDLLEKLSPYATLFGPLGVF